MRSAELSDDYIGTTEVIAHAVSWMQEQGWQLDAVCCIYATSVFLNKDDLVKGFEALSTGKWKYAFSVTDFEYPIFRSFKENPAGGVEMFFPEYFEKRSQDLPVALHDAAQFYWGKPEVWINKMQLSKSIIKEIEKIEVGKLTRAIQVGNNFMILRINDKRKINKKINFDEELKKLIIFEKNKQLNQLSLIYFKKIKQNIFISEL